MVSVEHFCFSLGWSSGEKGDSPFLGFGEVLCPPAAYFLSEIKPVPLQSSVYSQESDLRTEIREMEASCQRTWLLWKWTQSFKKWAKLKLLMFPLSLNFGGNYIYPRHSHDKIWDFLISSRCNQPQSCLELCDWMFWARYRHPCMVLSSKWSQREFICERVNERRVAIYYQGQWLD